MTESEESFVMAYERIITISRQFGSGGREIGEALAKSLDIKCYDKELISLAAKESGIDPEVFDNVDEKATNSLLYSLSLGLYSFGSNFSADRLPVNDKLYLLQHKIIKKLASEGPCVIVGRCADYVLRDKKNVLKLFICADIDYRIERTVEFKGIKREKAAQVINKTDKLRANYYNFYSGMDWGKPENYDICINRTTLSTEQIIDVVRGYLEAVK